MDAFSQLSKCCGFQWDEGNASKSWAKHKVSPNESEQIFFNQPLIVEEDARHSQKENRYYALGRTDGGRLLFIIFTIRQDLIRVISSRDMNRKERKAYLSP
jgi:uncharacterized protein